MEEEKKQKKSFKQWCDEHPKTIFGIRFTAWTLFSAILPFSFIAWRYGIFQSSCAIKLTGWGIIGVIILVVFGITLLKYVSKSMEPGMPKQCIEGLCKIVLPLVILLLLVVEIENHISLVRQALGCVILCEIVGIPLNPFPAYLEKRRIEKGEEQAENLSDIFWNKFFKKKKENGE